MNGRGLALVNAAGCLGLGLLLVMEWRKELALVERIHDLKASVVTAGDHLAAFFEHLPADRQLCNGMLEREQLAVNVQQRIAELLVIGFKNRCGLGGHRHWRGVKAPTALRPSLSNDLPAAASRWPGE